MSSLIKDWHSVFHKSVAITLSLFLSSALSAQHDVVAAGGSSQTANGAYDVSYGQPFCQYSTPVPGVGFSEGVQQVYPPRCPDTITADSETLSVCDSIEWNGSVYRTDTTVVWHTLTRFRCDSVVTLHLSVRRSSYVTQESQAAFRYSWDSSVYTRSGAYTVATGLHNAAGCDSLLQLRLSIVQEGPIPVIYSYNDQLLMVDHYPYGEDGMYAAYRGYRWYHNDVLMPYSTSDQYFEYREAAYQKLTGCFYVEVYTGVADYWVRSNELCIDPAKSSATTKEPTLTVWPNPSDRRQQVMASVSDAPSGSQMQLYDISGRTLWTTLLPDEGVLPLPPFTSSGVYSLVLRTPNGVSIKKKIIVR